MEPSITVLAFTILWQVATAIQVTSINSYGALADDPSVAAAVKNSQAISDALQKAAPGSAVLVPADSKYYIFSVSAVGLKDVQLWVEGDLVAIANITAWPLDGDNCQNVLHFTNCTRLVMTGKGTIDGQGYRWWVECVFNFLQHGRPHLVYMENCTNVLVENITMRNSPQFHLVTKHTNNFTVQNVLIWVDVTAQQKLLKSSPWKLPMFPLNTDGIDPSGTNILIQNVTINNYDDAVAVKPGKINSEEGCTENVTVNNAVVVHSVGMSIGSVPQTLISTA